MSSDQPVLEMIWAQVDGQSVQLRILFEPLWVQHTLYLHYAVFSLSWNITFPAWKSARWHEWHISLSSDVPSCAQPPSQDMLWMMPYGACYWYGWKHGCACFMEMLHNSLFDVGPMRWHLLDIDRSHYACIHSYLLVLCLAPPIHMEESHLTTWKVHR